MLLLTVVYNIKVSIYLTEITTITISTHSYSTFFKTSIHSLLSTGWKSNNTMSLKFVNERAVQNIIGDNTYNSDVDTSDSDIDFSHAITESDDNFDSEDEEPLSKHVPSALNNTTADASNAVDFDSEDE